MPRKTITDVWLERVEADVMPESHIVTFRNTVCGRADGWSYCGRNTNMTEAEAKRILLAFRQRVARDGGPLVTERQADKGRQWIERYGKRLGILEEYRTGITHFRFRGVRRIPHPHNPEYGRASFTPIYRAFYADGRAMTYSTGAWQSGKTQFDATYYQGVPAA